MSSHILVIDQGTTNTRALVFNSLCEVVAVKSLALKQYYPKPSWVEHDPNEILKGVYDVTKAALKSCKLTTKDLLGIGITNQRETTIIWDRNTGQPLGPAIVWQDRRTSNFIDSLSEKHQEIKSISGLIPDAYFSASKINWIIKQNPDFFRLAKTGALAFGTVESWLVWNFTKGSRHISDSSNASRTMLMDLETLKWSSRLLEIFEIPTDILPQITPCNHLESYFELDSSVVPIGSMIGDQQSATFGHLVFDGTSAKNTYGTGCFLMAPTDDKIKQSQSKLITTVAWSLFETGGVKTTYALEGSVFTTGAAIEWGISALGINSYEQFNQLAASAKTTNGTIFVPALSGLGAPYWDQYARGGFMGIHRGTNREELVRAICEGICCQVYDLVTALNKDLGKDLSELRVDGGASKSDFLMQLQSDLLQIPIIRPAEKEVTARGAALIAGLKLNMWNSKEELKSLPNKSKTFYPEMQVTRRDEILELWLKGVNASLGWANSKSK